MDLGIRGLDTQSFGSMGGIPTLDQTWAAFKNDSAVKIHLTEAWNDIMGEEYGVYDFQATEYGTHFFFITQTVTRNRAGSGHLTCFENLFVVKCTI